MKITIRVTTTSTAQLSFTVYGMRMVSPTTSATKSTAGTHKQNGFSLFILLGYFVIFQMISSNHKNNHSCYYCYVTTTNAWTINFSSLSSSSSLYSTSQHTFRWGTIKGVMRRNNCHDQELCRQRLRIVADVTSYRIITKTQAAAAAATTTATAETGDDVVATTTINDEATVPSKNIVIIGAGWGGLSTAHALSKNVAALSLKENHSRQVRYNITIIETSKRVGGLVQDGYTTMNGTTPTSPSQRIAEAGMHGFWNNYYNIYSLLRNDLHNNPNVNFNIHTALTDYQEQGQYSPNGLQAIWPVYKDQPIQLPTGFAHAIYTRFINIPLTDLISAIPLVTIAFADFDDSIEAWERYDSISFYDLCCQYGVSRRCYNEIFESMILTGLFAPGTECSAAAALGMAYFFVLQNQLAFDVQWCRGNIGTIIFDPWIQLMKQNGIHIVYNTRVTGFQFNSNDNSSDERTSKVTHVICTSNNKNNDGTLETTPTTMTMEVDDLVFAVGAKALNDFARYCPELIAHASKDFCQFTNLRGTSVLATRLYFDTNITIPYTANACWGFDDKIGMTVFDIRTIHGSKSPSVIGCPGSVLEVDYYHSSSLLVLSNDAIIAKVKSDLDTLFGPRCKAATVIDAAIVRLPEAVNWYFPGSYRSMPNTKAESISNIYFAGDIVRTRHGSWSQEKAFVTGMEVANQILRRPINDGIIPLAKDELHVQVSRSVIAAVRTLGVVFPVS